MLAVCKYEISYQRRFRNPDFCLLLCRGRVFLKAPPLVYYLIP